MPDRVKQGVSAGSISYLGDEKAYPLIDPSGSLTHAQKSCWVPCMDKSSWPTLLNWTATCTIIIPSWRQDRTGVTQGWRAITIDEPGPSLCHSHSVHEEGSLWLLIVMVSWDGTAVVYNCPLFVVCLYGTEWIWKFLSSKLSSRSRMLSIHLLSAHIKRIFMNVSWWYEHEKQVSFG